MHTTINKFNSSNLKFYPLKIMIIDKTNNSFMLMIILVINWLFFMILSDLLLLISSK